MSFLRKNENTVIFEIKLSSLALPNYFKAYFYIIEELFFKKN